MASLMRLLTRSSLGRGGQLKIIIESSTACQHRNVSAQIMHQIEDFIEKKKEHSKKLKKGIYELNNLLTLSLEKSEVSENSFELFKNIFLNYIYVVKFDEDIDLLLQFLKVNKKQIISNERLIYTTQIFKLLYTLGKMERALLLFKDETFGVMFHNKSCLSILTAALDENEQYEEIVNAFDIYVSHLTADGMVITREDILTSQIDVLTRSLLNLNSSESMAKLQELTKLLGRLGYDMSPSSVINSILLSINQNEGEFARKLFASNPYCSKINDPVQILVNTNLKILIQTGLNEIDSSLNDIQLLCSHTENPGLKFVYSKIFPETLNTLKEAVERGNNPTHVNKLNKIETILNEDKDLIRKFDFKNYSEFLIKKHFQKKSNASKSMPKKRKPEPQYMINASVQHLGDYDEPIFEQTQKADSNWRKLTYREQDMVTKLQNPDELSQDSLEDSSIKSLFSQNKFKVIQEVYTRNKDSDQFLNELPASSLSMISGSLFLTNSKDSLEAMKHLYEACLRNNIKISDVFKLHLYLLTIFQNEPNYGLGFLVLSGIDAVNKTIYNNLKVIAYINLSKYDQAFKEIQNILNIPVNLMQSQGCVLPFVINQLINSAKNSGDTDTIRKANDLKTKIEKSNRASSTDLYQLCSVNNNESTMRDFLLKLSNVKLNPSLESVPIGAVLATIQQDIYKNYKQKAFSKVLKGFEKYFQLSRKISVNNFKILSDSIVNNTTLPFDKMTSILERVEVDMNDFNSIKPSLNIYYKLTKIDPVYALEYLIKLTEASDFKSVQPTIYKNSLAIGLTLLGRFDYAIQQIKDILNSETNDESYEGKILALTLNVLEGQIKKLGDENQLNELENLIAKMNHEQRLLDVDISNLEL